MTLTPIVAYTEYLIDYIYVSEDDTIVGKALLPLDTVNDTSLNKSEMSKIEVKDKEESAYKWALVKYFIIIGAAVVVYVASST